MLFDHYVITRFNLPRHGVEASEEWLAHRLTIFFRYCAPSLAAQTCKNFRWLLLCSGATDPEILARLRAIGSFVDVLLDVRLGAARDYVRSGSKPWVVTTRLDNDDSLADTFVETVQRVACSQTVDDLYITLPRGYWYSTQTGFLYTFDYVANTTLSRLERRVLACGAHEVVHSHVLQQPVPVLEHKTSSPAWCVIHHERNLLNSSKPPGSVYDVRRLEAHEVPAGFTWVL